VIIELLLNRVDALTWDYWFWDANSPWLIILFGYLTFFIAAFWVYDLPDMKKRVLAVAGLWGFDLLLVLIFGLGLGWL
jgi:hypothetical protein